MRKNGLIAFLVLAIFGLILYWQVLIAGQVFFWHDVSIAYMPLRKLAQDAVQQGYLPVWTQQIGCGFPLLAEGQAGVFYPLHVIGYLGLPYYQTYSVMAYLHCLLAALFAALLARRIGLGWAAAVVAGLIYGFSGYFVTKVLFITVLETGAWLPLVLYLILGGFESGDWRYFLGGAFVFATCILGGHPQIVLYSMLAVSFLAVAYLIGQRQPATRRRLGRAIAGTGLVLALGAALAAAQLLPTYKLAEFANRRTEVTPQYLRSLGMSAHNLAYFIHPYILGSYAENNYFGRDHYYEVCGYAGGIALILALVGLSSPHKGFKYRWYFAVLVAFGLFMALAKYNPLYNILPGVPGFNLFRAPGRYLMLSTLGIAMLAGGGLQSLAGPQSTRQARRLTLWCLIAILLAATLMIGFQLGRARITKQLAQQIAASGSVGETQLTEAAIRQKAQAKYQFFCQRLSLTDPVWRAFVIGALLVGLAAWLVAVGLAGYQAVALVTIGVLAWQLLAFGLPYNGTVPASFYTDAPRTARIIQADPTPGRQYTDPRLTQIDFDPASYHGWLDGDVGPYYEAREILRPNSAVLYDVTAAEGHRYALLPRRQYEIMEERIPKGLAGEPEDVSRSVQLLRMLNVEYLLSVPELTGPELEALVRRPQYWLYRLRNPMPMVWLANGIMTCSGADEALSILTSPDFAPERLTAVEGIPVGTTYPNVTGKAEMVKSEGAALVARVEASTGTLVVMSVAYNPNLAARVDGNIVPIYRTNYMLCSVPVPAGDHTVIVEYKSQPLRIGALISLMALGLSAVLWVALSLSSRRKKVRNAS